MFPFGHARGRAFSNNDEQSKVREETIQTPLSETAWIVGVSMQAH